MAAHPKHVSNAKSAEKSREAHEKGISGKEGKISGISKTKQRLRRIKLGAKKAAVTAVAIAAGLAATMAPTPASAKNASSLTGMTDIRSAFSAEKEDGGAYAINLPDEFAPFPKGQSAEERIVTLSKTGSLSYTSAQLGKDTFSLKTSGGEVAFVLRNPEVLVFARGKEHSFTLDISQYNMISPVARLEETKDMKAIFHIIDVQTGTDLTLTFPLFAPPSAGRIKAKAFQDAGTAQISRNLIAIVAAGEKILEAERPKTIEEAREIYSQMGAEMVNKLREDCSAASSEQAPELAKRGQAVITAVLLRLYLSDDEDALMQLDELRMDPKLDKKTLEGFSWKNGILEEFQKIWPQCSASLEE